MRVWRDAQDLGVTAYLVTEAFPPDERFGLVSQIRRAVVSVSSNIAEGAGRRGGGEFAYHLGVAAGSLSEVDSQMALAARLGFVEDQSALEFSRTVASLRSAIFRLQQVVNR